MNRRQTKQFTKLDELPTAADYIAEGAAPLLIMVMVEALVWFAQDLVYRGEHELRLRWTLFWFVLGMVGISRIAIEKTAAYAGLYALALGGAVALMVNQFVPMPPAGWLLLGLIWWCTNKLVWDCTLIDDREDASGEGLLEIVGIDETAGEEPPADVGVQNIATETTRRKRRPACWQRLLVNQSNRPGQPHAHGLWIIYFSLAALPLFGFGQLWLVRVHPEQTGLKPVVVYLLAAMGLLLLTSFLGLRRYLRQRRLKMPVRIAGTWIGVGTITIVGALTLSFVLPRPVAMVASSESGAVLKGQKLDEKNVKNDAASDRESERAKSGGAEKQSSSNDRGNPRPDDAGERKRSGGQKPGGAKPEEAKPGQPGPSRLSLPRAPSWLRWIVWAAGGCVLLYMIVRNWRQIWLAIGQLIESLRALFRPQVKIPKHPPERRRKSAEATPGLRFSDLANPFRAGGNLAPAQAVCRTFEALELWSVEHGHGRTADTTSTEFAESLAATRPELRRGLRHLARVYAGLLYADRQPEDDELPALAELWEAMESNPAVASLQ